MQVDLAEAKTKLGELIDRAQAGETVEIAKLGKPAVTLVPKEAIDAPKKPVDGARLRKLHEGQPMQKVSAGEFMRAIRDDARY